MRFPSRVLFAKRELQRIFLRLANCSLAIILFVTSLFSGQRIITNFSQPFDTSNTNIFGNSVAISAYDTANIPIAKDFVLSENVIDSANGAEVIVSVGDTFNFFWGECVDSFFTVYNREVYISFVGNTMLSPAQTHYPSKKTPIKYLHVVNTMAPRSFLATFHTHTKVHVCIPNDSLITPIGKTRHSLCHIANDTFAIAYKESNTSIEMRKVVKTSNDIEFADGVATVIANNVAGPAGNFSNTSIAVDSVGNFLVLITRGGAGMPHSIDYLLTNRAYDINGTGNVANAISLNTTGDVEYDDAPVISYANNKFTAVYWKSDGVYLYEFDVAPNPSDPPTTRTTQIASGNSFRAATIAASSSMVIIVWKNLSAAARIEGKILTVSNGTLSLAPAKTIVFSDVNSIVDNAGPELNAAVNTKGSIAMSWRQQKSVVGCIWGRRGVMFPTAQWVSFVDSVTIVPGDSIVFMPGIIDTVLPSGVVTCSLQVGSTADFTTNWTSWLDISSASNLAQNTKNTSNYFRFKVDFFRSNTDSTSSPILNEVSLKWNLKPGITKIDSLLVNRVKVSGSVSFGDTIDMVSHSDTVDWYFTSHDGDTGDTIFASATWPVMPSLAKDTITGSVDLSGMVRFIPDTVWDTVYNCLLSEHDCQLWPATPRELFLRVRKAAPVITDVTFDGKAVSDYDAVKISNGILTTVSVTIERTKIVPWNQISYRFTTKNFDTVFTTASKLSFSPAYDDTALSIIVTDMFGMADTLRMQFVFSIYEIDTSINPGYSITKRYLVDSISYILGADITDTFSLPIHNSGIDTLIIDSIHFSGSSKRWFHLGVWQPGGMVYFGSLTNSSGLSPLAILPDSSKRISFVIDADNVLGDNVLYDTVFLWTNDPIYPVDTIPVTFEYNTLPIITGLSFVFDSTKPYWERKKEEFRDQQQYVFPPHAKIKISFSEPMDTLSALGRIVGYSLLEFIAMGTIDSIRFAYEWADKNSTLILIPQYTLPSELFFGIIPDSGLFIPTDSIILQVSSNIRDIATTPASPNYLDVNKDFKRDINIDTLIRIRVDSIHFTIDTVIPHSFQQSIASNTPIIIEFSSPVYPGTFDTSLKDNKSLIVTTRYYSFEDTNNTIFYDSINITGNRITLYPAKQFFFKDSVYCYYRGASARDSLGFSVDINNDGIPANFFDSASRVDDYFWSFYINDNIVNSTTPASAVHNIPISTPITLNFSSNLHSGAIDTALVGNRSLYVTSQYSEGTRINFSRVVVDSKSAIFYLEFRLFYGDSVFCEFDGLLTKDTNNFFVDIGNDTIHSTQNRLSWYFIAQTLEIESVSPDSAARNIAIKEPITIHFTGPISPMIFDTTINADSNKSFIFTTGYSSLARMPISKINFSPDSASVSIIPEHAYFSYDSIYCEFVGYRAGYSYLKKNNLVPDTTLTEVINAYSWYFLTRNDGFYTFPNPYKPGSNSRHRNCGGIWFKNLHTVHKIRGHVKDVIIKVFSIQTHLIFESPVIHFEENDPEQKPIWLWDTKNNQGNLIASGVYLYIISDARGKSLLKGKVLIVR